MQSVRYGKTQSFAVQNAVLMHKSGEKLCRVVVDEQERDSIVASLHAREVGGCYYGQTATIRKVADRVWWRNVTADVRAVVRSCDVCQKTNPLIARRHAATLHSIAVGGVRHRWGIDLVGPLQETVLGNKYIVVATEYLTKWPEALPVPDKLADSVHRFLLDLVYTASDPVTLLSTIKDGNTTINW